MERASIPKLYRKLPEARQQLHDHHWNCTAISPQNFYIVERRARGGLTVRQMVRFGLLADVQFSDLDNGDTEGRIQRFREAPGKLLSATEDFARHVPALAFVLSLGDVINGNNDNPGMLQDSAAFAAFRTNLSHPQASQSWRLPTFQALLQALQSRSWT